jgi:hypothetical protein
MLAMLDETIRQMLIEGLPISNGEVEVAFELPEREWATGRVKPTINFYLYSLVENTELRRNDWTVERNGGRATKRRAPRRIDATYLVTAWAGAVEDEHRLLWRTLALLLRHPELPEETLQGVLMETEKPLPAQVLTPEEILNPSDLWTALDNELRPAIHYRVTLLLDVLEPFVGPLVLTKRVRVEQGLRGEGPFEELWQIGGTVRGEGGEPVADAEVRVKGWGLLSYSNEAGRYTFANLAPGTYTFVITPPGGKPIEQEVEVPGENYDVRA